MLFRSLDEKMDVTPEKTARTLAEIAPEVRAASIRTAAESVVLLRNERNRLPLAGVRRIALVGGLADSAQDHMAYGPARASVAEVVTLRRAISERAAKAGVEVSYVDGCRDSCARAKPGDPVIAETARREIGRAHV